MNEAALPLHNRRVFDSRDADATRAFMASKEFKLDLAPREAKNFDFIANVAYMPGSYLGYIQYGAAATFTFPISALETTFGCICRCAALARSPTAPAVRSARRDRLWFPRRSAIPPARRPEARV